MAKKQSKRKLSAKDLKVVKDIYDLIGRYVDPTLTLKQWETSFISNVRPDRQVIIWRAIARAWHDFHDLHGFSKPMVDNDERLIVDLLMKISEGRTTPTALGIPDPEGRGKGKIEIAELLVERYKQTL